MLNRELAVRDTLDVLRQPNRSASDIHNAVHELFEHFDARYILDDKPAPQVLEDIARMTTNGDISGAQALLERLRFEGRGTLGQGGNTSPGVTRRAA